MIDDINDSSGTSDFKQSDMTDFRNLLKKRASNHSQFYRRLSSVPTIKRFTDQNTFYGTNNSTTTTTAATISPEDNNDIATNISCVNIINLTEKLSVANIPTNIESDKKADNEKSNHKKIHEKPLNNDINNKNKPHQPSSSTINMNQSVQDLCCEKKSSDIGCSCDTEHVLDTSSNKTTTLQQLICKEQQHQQQEHNQQERRPVERLSYDIMKSTSSSTISSTLISHKLTIINESPSLATRNANAIVKTADTADTTAVAEVATKAIIDIGDAASTANTIIDPPTKSLVFHDDTILNKKACNQVLVNPINNQHNQSLDNNNKICEQEEWNRSNYLTFVPATSLQRSQQLARCRRRCCCCCSNNNNNKNSISSYNNNNNNNFAEDEEEDQFDVCCSKSGRLSNIITNKEDTNTILDDLAADPDTNQYLDKTKKISDEYEATNTFKTKFSYEEKKLTEKYSKLLRQRKLPIIDSDRELFTIETTNNSVKLFENNKNSNNNNNNNNNISNKNNRKINNNNQELENYTFPCVEKLVKMYTKLLQEKKGGDRSNSPRSSIDEITSIALPVQHEQEEDEEDLKSAIDKSYGTQHLQISTKLGRGGRLRSLERNDLNPSPISDEGCPPGQSPYSSDYDDNEHIPDDNDVILIGDIDKEKVIRSSSSDSALGLDEDATGGDRSSSPTNLPTGRRMTLTVTDIPLRSALLPLAEPTSLPDSPTSLTPPAEPVIPSVVPVNATACPPERPIVTQTAIPSKVILEERIVEIPEDKFNMHSVSRRESAQSCMSDYNSSEYGGVRYVRTPSVVVSDYSDDVMCGITLEEIEYFRAHRMRRRSSADTQTEKDDAASDVSAASSCSNLYYCGSTISALDGADCYVNGMRMGVDRKISDCSTCSTVSGDEEDDSFHYDHIKEHPNQQVHHHNQSQQTQQQQQQPAQPQIRKNKKVGVVDLI